LEKLLLKEAKGFEMEVLYTDVKSAPKEIENKLGTEFVSLGELLSTSDFVTIHILLLPETRHLIGEKELRMMKNLPILSTPLAAL